MIARINKTLVESLKPGSMVWDEKLTGFGVRLLKKRTTYLVKYGAGRRADLDGSSSGVTVARGLTTREDPAL